LFSQILANAENPLTSFFGSLIAIVFTLGGALGAFSVLVKSVNDVWEINPARLRFKENIKEKMEPFLLIGSAGFVVVVWTAFSTVLFNIVFVTNPTGVFVPILLRIMQIILSFGLGTLLFAIIFKYLPEIHVEWRDVVLAAVITSFVFTFLNYIFGIYVALFPPTTIAGTAGSLMLLFLWIYLANWFMLFGAQLSKIYAATFGSHPIRTLREKKEEEQRMEQVEKIEVKAKLEWKLSPDKQNN
jgi:membrane protein